jgi:hypothetical protein
VADVYDPQQPISSKADLLDKYIDRQLSFDKREIDRRKELKEYQWAYRTVKLEPDWKKTRSHLKWIAWNLRANNQVEFLIEHLQPSSIRSTWIEPLQLQQRYRLIFGLINGLIFGLITVLMIGPIFGLNIGLNVDLITVLIIGLIFGLTSALINEMTSAVMIFGLIKGLTFWQVGGLMMRNTMISGLISGLIFGIIFGRIKGLNIRTKKELKFRLRPNQGIWNSLQNQMLIAIIFFVTLILLFIPFSWLQYWTNGLFIALFVGFAVGGGKACLQHLSLRIVLRQSGLPWNFARFLNYCVERRLLLRVGGSYRFLHRELLDHFAQSNR